MQNVGCHKNKCWTKKRSNDRNVNLNSYISLLKTHFSGVIGLMENTTFQQKEVCPYYTWSVLNLLKKRGHIHQLNMRLN